MGIVILQPRLYMFRIGIHKSETSLRVTGVPDVAHPLVKKIYSSSCIDNVIG
jgi:hypothetical protein